MLAEKGAMIEWFPDGCCLIAAAIVFGHGRTKQRQMKKRKAVSLNEALSEDRRLTVAVRYVPGGNIPNEIPAGQVLMHNDIRHEKTTPAGDRGFRAWFAAKPLDGFVPCPCGWSGLKHYAHSDYVKGLSPT